MIRISCVLTLALAFTSCGKQGDTAGEQGDTAGVVRIDFEIKNDRMRISGSFENMSAKSVADELLKRFRGDWAGAINVTGSSLAPLEGYEVTNKLTDSPGKRFTFKFELKTLADLKELLEKELKATVTLDEKAKTFTVE